MNLFQESTGPIRLAGGADLYLGTSGYSFPQWSGVFYPNRIKRADWLRYYALKLNSVEINSTYYRILSRETTERMADSVPEGFSFSVKLHSSMTHAHNAGTGEWKAFLDMLEPFRRSGRMGMVLAQFPWSFPLGQGSFEKLQVISDRLAGLNTAAEFRHSRWYGEGLLKKVAGMGFVPVSVDMPKLSNLPRTGLISNSGTVYLRLHGRNKEKWWGNTQERYDYLYSREELHCWAKELANLSATGGRCYVFFNNCHMGSAALNAADMEALLHGKYGGR